jgi:competence protein ComEA
VDLDRAPAREIARLPRIGLALAKSIVADREAKGPFGSLQGLDRVSGIGPGLLRLIAPHAAFSGVKAGPPLPAEVPTGIPLAPAASGRRSDPAPGPLDLNTADSVALERLSGIGPTLAGRIVAYRLRHGPFAAVQDLIRVPGLGPGTLSRLKPSLTVGP